MTFFSPSYSLVTNMCKTKFRTKYIQVNLVSQKINKINPGLSTMINPLKKNFFFLFLSLKFAGKWVSEELIDLEPPRREEEKIQPKIRKVNF